MSADLPRPILYFDGVCNLCDGLVQFLIRHDKKKRFLFASLQSEAGKQAIAQVQNEKGHIADSMILFYKGKYYQRSAAALRIPALLDGLWPVFSIGLLMPSFIRDAIYDYISRRRYKWFGKKDECMIPTPELQSRFL